MQLSRYLKVYPCRERAGYLLLFSTKKASKILIKEETYHAIKKGLLSPSDEALLSRFGFIVEDREAEKEAMLNFFDDANSRDPGLNLIVVLNLDCNFSCIYCYEGDMKGKLYLSLIHI